MKDHTTAGISGPTTTEKVFTVFVLFYSTDAFWRVLQGQRDVDSIWKGAPLTNGLWVFAYTVAFLLLRRRCAVPAKLWRTSLPMLLPVAVALLSLIWSQDRLLTFLRGVALIGTVVLALYIALRFTLRQILGMLACALGIAAISSLIVAICVPSFGVGTDGFEGLWIGAFGQKNDLGMMMVFAFLVFLLLFWYERPRKIMWFGLACLSLFLVIKAASMSSFVICCALPYLLWASDKTLRSVGRFSTRLLCFAFPVVVLFAGLASKFDAIVEMLGKDVEFSGRTTVWVLALQAVLEKPYLGYGYQAFWTGYEGAAGEIWEKIGFQYYSHNGFVEVLLGMGLVGLISILIAFAFYAKNALLFLQENRSVETAWPWALLLCLLGSNLLEGTFMKSNNLPWFLYLITAFSLSRVNSKCSGQSGPIPTPAVAV